MKTWCSRRETMAFSPEAYGVRTVKRVAVCAATFLLLSSASVEGDFVDLRESAGVDFVHFSDSSPEKLLPEAMGGGLAVFDSDADGDLDLYFVNGARLHDTPPGPDPTNALYRNDGETWTDVARLAGVYDPGGKGLGVALIKLARSGSMDGKQSRAFYGQAPGASLPDGVWPTCGAVYTGRHFTVLGPTDVRQPD